MSQRVYGLTVEIGGDTTRLKKALNNINATSKSLKTELNYVNKALKLDPGNIELTRQKQQILNDVIAATKDRLDAMKQAQEQAQQLMREGTEVNQEEYRRLQREIVFAQNELQEYQNELAHTENSLARIGDSISGVGGKITDMGNALMPVTAVITGLGVAAVKTAADFDSSMSQVQATMGITKDAIAEVDGQTVNTMDTLSTLAKKMGAETSFSASECAEALNYLALAGYDTQKMCDTLPTILNLAAAGSIDLASASDMVTDAMSALGMEISEAALMVDQMAKTASITNTSVAQLGEGMLTIGSTAKSLKGGTAELSTALGILANNGKKGAEGGTHLRNIIISLQNPTEQAAECLKTLGVNAYDNEGKMRSLNKILQNLNTSMDSMTDQQKSNIINTIFNKTDISSVNDLLANTGAVWDDLQQSIIDSSGAAQQMADTQLDNLKGQLTILKSALEGLAISIGEILMPVIRNIVAHIQALVDKLNNMSDAQKRIVVGIAAVVAAAGPALLIIGKILSLGGALLTGIGKFHGVITKLQTVILAANTTVGGVFAQGIGKAAASIKGMGAALSSTIAPLLQMAAPILPIVAAVGALIAVIKHLWDTNEEFRNKIMEIWGSLMERVSQFVQDYKSRLEELGIDFESVVASMQEAWDAFCSLLAPVIEGVFAQIVNTVSAALDVLTGVLDVFIGLFSGNWNQFFQGIGEIAEAAVNYILNKFAIIGETILGIFGISSEAVETTWEEMWEYLKELPGKIWDEIAGSCRNAFDGIIGFFQDTWNNIVNFFEQGIPEFIDNVAQWLADLPYNIGLVLGTLIGKIIVWKEEMKKNAGEAVRGFVKEAIDNIREFPDRIREWFDNTIKRVLEWKETMKKQAGEAADGFIKSAIDYIKELPDKIKEWFDNVIEKVLEWKDNLKQKGREAIDGFIQNIIEGAKSIPEKLPEIGKAIVDGIWKGIKDAKDNFVKKIEDFFAGLVDGVKSVLGIASPSKVMAKEVGQWIPKGVASGIDEAGNAVDESMDRMFEGISKRNKTGFNFLPETDGINMVNVPADSYANIDMSILNEIAGILDTICGCMPELITAAGSRKEIYLKKGVLAGEIVNELDNQIARIQRRKERG